ncbi:MAG: hypothetical protein KF718_26310 [Polyangiaceae bacterium]|nr:hypothetical protein [Polyangiaceae bacterium]
MSKVCLGMLVVATASACQQGSASERGAAPSAAGSASPASPQTAGVARNLGVTWTAPDSFSTVTTPSAMRAASYRVPPAPGDPEAGDLGVFYFGADEGGGVERNVSRWVAQFPDVPAGSVKRRQRTENGLLQHIVEIEEGTFQSGMPGGPTTPKPGHALYGAIVEAPSGLYFFKLTGPKATVAAARAPLETMLATVAPK